jgi:hypothetical protein
MLTRRPVPEAQRLLYRALYAAAEKGISGKELPAAIERTRSQLAGVLGALGVRINGTEGLENKGSVKIIFEIDRLENGDYLYRIKPILRKALELEHLV